MRYVRNGALLALFLVGLYPRPKHLWRNVCCGALTALCLGVVSLWVPVWPGTMTQTHTYKTYPIHVPFWDSNYYHWLKANDFNLLLLVP